MAASNQPVPARAMSRGRRWLPAVIVLAVVCIGFGGGFAVRRAQQRREILASLKARSAEVLNQLDHSSVVNLPPPRLRVPLEAPFRGPANAKVTIVEVADFECPFSTEVQPTIAKILADYPDTVRLSFRFYPSMSSPNAQAAARLALAADAQGKFWEMHDKLFQNRSHLEKDDLTRYAREVGLDQKLLAATLASGAPTERIEADTSLAESMRLEGTPVFFVNGRQLKGAVSYADLKEVVDAELLHADNVLAMGTPPDRLYEKVIENGQRVAMLTTTTRERPNPALVYRAGLGTLPPKGDAEAVVTIVEWASYDCDACRQVEGTLDRLLAAPGNKRDVRVVWRDFPGSTAAELALAARAAGEQGKFWEMHDRLLTKGAGRRLSRRDLESMAGDLGLDLPRFRRDMDARKQKLRVAADVSDAGQLGVHTAPSFFVNGRFLEGPAPYEAFEKVLNDSLVLTGRLTAGGETARADVYDALMRSALMRTGSATLSWDPEDDRSVRSVAVGKSSAKGPADAPVTVIEFGDFTCPFTRRLQRNLTKAEHQFPDKLRVVWKNYPKPENENAELAAEAALEAEAQGKFWQMHDRMLTSETELDRATLDKLAQELHLDMPRFRAALGGHAHADRIQQEVREGNDAVALGTPTTFINGRVLPGVYPFEIIKTMIEQALVDKEIGRIARGPGPKE